MNYFSMIWIVTSIHAEDIAFELRLADNLKELIIYQHDKGDIRGFIKAIHPSTFLIEFSQDPEEPVLSIENLKIRKSELIFPKKMLGAALDFWQD